MHLVVIGGIYYVDESRLTLLPAEQRLVHETRRPVVVLSGSDTNSDPNWSFVLCCPISGSTTSRTRFCVKLAAGDGGVVKKCWIRVPAVQPLMKEDLEDLAGSLPEAKLQEAQARLAEYLGLLSEPETVEREV